MGNFSAEIKIIKEKQIENLELRRSTKLIMKNSHDELFCIYILGTADESITELKDGSKHII